MILPTKTIEGGRTCASKDSILTFFRKTCSFVSDMRLVHFLIVFSFWILTAFLITLGKKFLVHGTGKYDASEKMKKTENVETPLSKNNKD